MQSFVRIALAVCALCPNKERSGLFYKSADNRWLPLADPVLTAAKSWLILAATTMQSFIWIGPAVCLILARVWGEVRWGEVRWGGPGKKSFLKHALTQEAHANKNLLRKQNRNTLTELSCKDKSALSNFLATYENMLLSRLLWIDCKLYCWNDSESFSKSPLIFAKEHLEVRRQRFVLLQKYLFF